MGPLVLPRHDSFAWKQRGSSAEAAWKQRAVSGHIGPEQLLAELRRRYWIIGGRKVVKRFTSSCIISRRIVAAPMERKRANLPSFLVGVVAPFMDTGFGWLGLLVVKSGRQERRVGVVVFIRMRERAVFLDFVASIGGSCMRTRWLIEKRPLEVGCLAWVMDDDD